MRTIYIVLVLIFWGTCEEQNPLEIMKTELTRLGYEDATDLLSSLQPDVQHQINDKLSGEWDWVMSIFDPAKEGPELPNVSQLRSIFDRENPASRMMKREHLNDQPDSAQRKPFDEITKGYDDEETLSWLADPCSEPANWTTYIASISSSMLALDILNDAYLVAQATCDFVMHDPIPASSVACAVSCALRIVALAAEIPFRILTYCNDDRWSHQSGTMDQLQTITIGQLYELQRLQFERMVANKVNLAFLMLPDANGGVLDTVVRPLVIRTRDRMKITGQMNSDTQKVTDSTIQKADNYLNAAKYKQAYYTYVEAFRLAAIAAAQTTIDSDL